MNSFRRFLKYKLLLISVLLVFTSQVHALSITKDTTPQWSGNDTGQKAINDVIFDFMGDDYFELYKSDVSDLYEAKGIAVGIDSGDYASDYTTVFSGDPNSATITWQGDNYISPISYMLVKDGNAQPAWYLFKLSNPQWDGQETLSLSEFWQNTQGSISHISLYGTVPVPEPATMLLLGFGLFGVILVTRKRFKKES